MTALLTAKRSASSLSDGSFCPTDSLPERISFSICRMKLSFSDKVFCFFTSIVSSPSLTAHCSPHAARRPIRLRRLDGQSLLRQQILVVSKVRRREHRVAVGDGQGRGKIIVGKISRQRGDCHQQRQQEREEQHRKQFPHQKSPAFVGNTRSGSLYHTFQAHTRHIL